MNLQKDFFKIENQPGFTSLLGSYENGNLANSNLLVCRDIEICNAVALFFATKILRCQNLETCVDFLQVRPAGSMMQISVDQIRKLCSTIYLSPKVCEKKFAVIYDVGRMHNAAANAFLKTLEEPPSDTIIFLTTSRLHAILPTIAGRCSVTRLSSGSEFLGNEEMQVWLASYSAWLSSLFDINCEKKTNAIMQMYLLLTQFEALLANLIGVAEANDFTGSQVNKQGIYGLILARIENETAKFFRNNLDLIKIFPKIISNLEDKTYLVTLNVNFMSCIESFLIEIFQMIIKSSC
ncbi:MAG: hypothetical protein LBB16_04385 [Puniceicoccales bacterium]|jgi:DNA polymerase-3 subunit delta'|nr:hypothetical protein [Puniceicoccales bacterium]